MTGSTSSPTSAAPCWPLALLGIAIGVLTSYAQGWLPAPWSSLANSASPWLTVAFLVGRLQRNLATAAVIGALTCIGEVAAYYCASQARGFGVSMSFVVFWVGCSLVGGPVFGACGRLARGRSWTASLGAAAPAATFLGEALGSYWIRLGYHQDATLFAVVGLAAAVLALAVVRSRALTLAFIVAGTVAGTVVYGFVLRMLG